LDREGAIGMGVPTIRQWVLSRRARISRQLTNEPQTQNIAQAAEADLMRRICNKAATRGDWEVFAFRRLHVRRAKSVKHLLLLALMNQSLKSKKKNTNLIYGNAVLLVEAIKGLT
jgi:hypothetical protein